MIKPLTDKYVINKLREWTSDEQLTPSLVISIDDGSFHLVHYQGMGNYDNTPIEQLDPLYQQLITKLYRLGELKTCGKVKAFTLYPGSDFFKKLVFSC